jgi:hypothetical protein
MRRSRMCKMKILHVWVTLLATTLLFVGCSNKEQASTPAPERAQPSAPAPEAKQPAPPAPAAVPGSASSQPAATALASSEGELPGITVTLQELKRAPNSVTLKLTFINHSNTPLSFYDAFGESDLRHIHLVDMVGKKKYFVVQDSHGDCLCSRQLKELSPGAQVALWAKFPPVPDEVQKITVEIPHFPPLEDLPISR